MFSAFELFFESLKSHVDGFFERVGGFVSDKIRVGREADFNDSLFIESSFRFNDFEGDVESSDVGIVTGKTFSFFSYESFELVGCIEVDGLNTNVHNFKLSFVREDARVYNY